MLDVKFSLVYFHFPVSANKYLNLFLTTKHILFNSDPHFSVYCAVQIISKGFSVMTENLVHYVYLKG